MERREDDNNDDEEKAFLANEQAEHKAFPQVPLPTGLSRKFWFFSALNTLSTVGIVSSDNRRIRCERANLSTGLRQQAIIRP